LYAKGAASEPSQGVAIGAEVVGKVGAEVLAIRVGVEV
jgi:hypothetical protein